MITSWVYALLKEKMKKTLSPVCPGRPPLPLPTLSLNPRVIILGLLILIALPVLYYGVPIGQDWIEFFRPATLSLIHGQNPYSIQDFHNAPWVLIPFIPFALMPYQWGRVGFFVISLACFIYIAHRLNAKPVSMILFLTSYPVITGLNGGGIDWLPMLAFVTPAPISLIFAAMKPQIGIGIALYWMIYGWELGGIRLMIRWSLPVVILLAGSFALYGFWPLTFIGKGDNPVNISIFPYLIPLGIYFLWTKKKRAAMAAGPFLSPYHTVFTLAVPLVALLDHPKLLAVASALLWAWWILQAMVYPYLWQ